MLLLVGLSACGHGGGSLPTSGDATSTLPASTLSSAATRAASASEMTTAAYTYTAPWGGFGASNSIYFMAQGSCNDIAATAGVGFSWPSLLSTLTPGTVITIRGVPSFSDAWSQAHGCPTGGIVASNVVVGTAIASPASSGANVASASQISEVYAVPSRLFTAPNNPFHMTVVSLVSKGARLQSQTLMNNLWSQGYYQESESGTPVYSGNSNQGTYTVYCTYYNQRGCNAQGIHLHLPSGAYPQNGGDHHISGVDSADKGEFDGWGGGGGSQGCAPGSGSLNCSWGGWYPFSGKGLEGSGNSGNHGGYAFGLFTVTAQELLNGHIGHALGWNVACLDNPTVYPADTSNGSDFPCSGGHGASPSVSYGQLIHLKWSSSQIAASGYSQPCKTILTAMAEYGIYPYDDGNGGIQLSAENPQTYSNPNPWYTTIYPKLVAGGDGSGSGSGFYWSSCLNRLNASAFEVYDIPNLGY